MRLGKTTLYHLFSLVVASVAGFAAKFVIAVWLGAASLGIYTVVAAVGFFWLLVPGEAVATAVRKRMSETGSADDVFAAGIVLNTGLVVAIAAFVFGVSRAITAAGMAEERELFVAITTYDTALIALVVGGFTLRTAQAAFEGKQRVEAAGALQAIERVLRSVVLIAFVALGFGVARLALGHAASLLLVGVAGIYAAKMRFDLPSRERLVDLLSYAQYAWMGSFRSRVFGWLDTLVLSVFVSATLIGIYEVAWGIASLLAMASTSIRRALFPAVSNLSSQSDYDRIKHFLDEGLVFAGVFVIPGVVGAALLGERVLSFYTPEYAQGADILVVLVLAYVADVYAGQFVNVINAVDEPRAAYRVNIAFVTANVVLNVALVWVFGWLGAAVATALSALLRTVLGYWTLRRIIGRLQLPVREVGIEVFAAAAMGGLLVPIAPRVPAGRVGTVVLVGFGAAVYFAVLLTLSGRVRRKFVSLAPQV